MASSCDAFAHAWPRHGIVEAPRPSRRLWRTVAKLPRVARRATMVLGRLPTMAVARLMRSEQTEVDFLNKYACSAEEGACAGDRPRRMRSPRLATAALPC